MKLSTLLAISTFALWSGGSAAQEINCTFSHQVRSINSVSGLPQPVSAALRADGLYPDDASTAGPRFHGAGRYGDYYFVWSSAGDRVSFETISLYRMGAGDRLAVRVAGEKDQWPNTKEAWCERTDKLLKGYPEPSKPANRAAIGAQ